MFSWVRNAVSCFRGTAEPDLSGPRFLTIRVTKDGEKYFIIHVTDQATERWFKYEVWFPLNPLEQTERPEDTLRDFLDHTGTHVELSHPEFRAKHWKHGLGTIPLIIRTKRALYNAVIGFLKKCPEARVGVQSGEVPATHMFCRELAGTWFHEIK